MKALKVCLRVAIWTVLGTATAVLAAYVPGALGIVDDYKYGRLIGKLFFPTVILFFLSGILFASNHRRAAMAVAGTVVFGYLALDAWAVGLHVTGQGRHPSPTSTPLNDRTPTSTASGT